MKTLHADFQGTTTKELELVVSEYELSTPEIQKYTLDVKGRDGAIDLSEINGKVTYKNRKAYMKLYDARDFEQRKKSQGALTTAIHGKESNLVMSNETEYTISGRWHVDVIPYASYTEYSITGDCYPFRHRGTYIYRINAAGGVTLALESGDKQVRPIIEVNRPSLVQFEGQTYRLNPGAYYIEDLYFRPGVNLIHIDTYPGGGNVTWAELKAQGITWGEFKTKRVSEWKWGNEPPQQPYTWKQLKDAGVTWGEFKTKRVIEWQHPVDTDNEQYAAYIQFERMDF